MKDESISFTENSELFLKCLIEHNFNFCVVTNTNQKTVDIFKEKLPLLNEIKQWIYRDNYHLPKPNQECYELAKCKYYKNEKYILGFEDSVVGYKALQKYTDFIYLYKNKTNSSSSLFDNIDNIENDCVVFDNYHEIMCKQTIKRL